MQKTKFFLVAAILLCGTFILTGCGNKNTNTNTNKNTNTVVTEAPFTMSGATKVFNLKLVNGLLNYKTMTFYAGDTVEVRLTDANNQPVEFEFKGITQSANGVFNTSIANDDKGGIYQLTCVNIECGSLAVTVINQNANTSTNTVTNTSTNTSNANAQGVTKVEMQRIPAGTTFDPASGATYATTTNFTVGDQFGLSVTGVFDSGATTTHAILDASGTVVDPQGMSTALQTGTNGTCCYTVPSTAGSYTVKVYVNGTEAQSVPITVAAQ